jgi:hypothetical protein
MRLADKDHMTSDQSMLWMRFELCLPKYKYELLLREVFIFIFAFCFVQLLNA